VLNKIKILRETTGLGMMACKKAIEETNGDVDKAIVILRKKGIIKAAQRSERETTEGIIGTYLHSNKKIAAMVLVACETDFVARNEEFIQFTQDVAMHITAMTPRYVSPEDVTDEDVKKEKDIYVAQLEKEGKPADMIEKIMEGKVKKFREGSSLLKQPFVKDQNKTIEQLIVEVANKVGENIRIVKFERFSIK